MTLLVIPKSLALEQPKLFRYHFTWGFLPVANLTIDFSEFKSKGLISSEGQTIGLSRLLKSYKAKVTLQETSDKSGRAYKLQGVDNGIEELREIKFTPSALPQVIDFKDSLAPSSLTPQSGLDETSVDPLTVFSWFFLNDFDKLECFKKFRVFDGKKRFLVAIANVGKGKADSLGKIGEISCRITMKGDSLEAGHYLNKSQNTVFWPFNRKDQFIEVVIYNTGKGISFISEIYIQTPLGKIIGKLKPLDSEHV